MSDSHPNSAALEHVERLSGGRIRHLKRAVDAVRVPAGLLGFRTLFNGFHHFRPEQASAVLQDAMAHQRGIAIFDGTDRRALDNLTVLLSPIGVFFVAPFIRPLRLTQVLFTYLIPLSRSLFPSMGSARRCEPTRGPNSMRSSTRFQPMITNGRLGLSRLARARSTLRT